MTKTTTRLLAVLAAALPAVAGNAQNLLIPESGDDRVLLVSAQDGTVLDANFLDIATPAAAADVSSTPLHAIEVGDEIWVSDQVADRIWRFDRTGGFLGDIAPGELNNIRGMEVVGDSVYAAVANDSPTVSEGIVRIDIATRTVVGTITDRPTADISFYDVVLVGGEFLASNIDGNNDAIERYALDGTFLGFLAQSDGEASFDFPQQINVRASNGNLLIGGFSPPSGVYELLPDGTDLGIVAGVDFGTRAGYELGNGEILWTNGSFLRTDSTTILSDGSFRFISPTSITLGTDSDADGLIDSADNCVAVANADQLDADGDGIGNICDADLSQDCIVNVSDLGLLRSVFFGDDAVADFNGDGVVNVVDLGILRVEFFNNYAIDNPSGLINICSPL